MIIGIPKEIMHGEDRVAATPETCELLVKDGHKVLVEKGAGEGAYFHDPEYEKAGAEIVSDVKKLFSDSEIILKVKEPLYNDAMGCHEIDMMHKGQYLITFIHPAAPVNHEMVKNMAKKGVISLTLDGVPRISRAQNMDALTSMSTCAGYKGILIAANLLPRFIPQIFCAVGMIKPMNVLVVGTGVGGLQALATAKRLGAVTYAADIRPAAREQAQSLGAKIIDLGVPENEAIGEGGYALHLKKETLENERKLLAPHIKDMDIIFLSALVPGKLAPVIITEEMVKTMKPGSVIVDISIDQGGNCELTPPGEVVKKHNVHLVGIKNIPGLLPSSSTWMFAQNICNLTRYLIKDGKIELDRNDDIVKGILTTIDGEIVHKGAREAMGI
ncbi:NAD(P) transhydrogenase subunit alpha [Treponema denticola]|uniref:proton-translocating NAD(P)(+) transhydrogenase n=2 Tax=Treponema denticola TaxID=158 RepID=A0A0F6MPG5_TREDN|nr:MULTISPECIES: NAD(P) transhydrogenase subunit alpha [Treponema]EGC76398.1 NADPH-NAD transhydrogenase [Treponema denticola F0402]EMB20806.1 NAD(P)(+) transhydrogenase (AB-specific), alpha subunit [Treponema denticola OTK]EMB30833.1 NAD(P)(+) transhydrogenase (AB-specific), alpha subunit [Treponema denticola H-22]EMB33570.1 NAD(P)(+) transhydrogenase (AB-specific), alpha subunit [Treponema denticola ATCC 35404]EMB37273.1 NAD(P)(+) transhydrogenase (AB-specific), alpha subunit [Treponema denti